MILFPVVLGILLTYEIFVRLLLVCRRSGDHFQPDCGRQDKRDEKQPFPFPRFTVKQHAHQGAPDNADACPDGITGSHGNIPQRVA